VIADVRWRSRRREGDRFERRSDVVGDAFRAITDDGLLRFFAVIQTAGKLG
jgi:hypothetical protein